jgi:HEAT repeat protein
VTLADRLRSPDPAERVAAIAEIGGRSTVAADELAALAECLGHARKAVQRPAADACAALAAQGIDVRPVLAAALASPLARQRWGAAFALARMGTPPPETLPVLLETLGGDDGDLRWAAAAILRRLPEQPAVVEALVGLVRAGNGAQRKMGLYCLRDLGARGAELEQAALWALGDAQHDVRLAAIAWLVRHAVDRAAVADRLLVALTGDDPQLARAAAAGLGTLGEGSPRVVSALRAACATPDPSLRRAAEGALRQLGVGGA